MRKNLIPKSSLTSLMEINCQGKHHPAHDPEAMAENLYRSRTRQADASDPFHKVYRTIGYR